MDEQKSNWEKTAADYERPSNYIVGKVDLDAVTNRLAGEKNLGRLLELGAGPESHTGKWFLCKI